MAVAPFVPFCSERCKSADLGVWLTGGYRVPAPLVDLEDLDAMADGDAALTPLDDDSDQETVS